MKTPQLALLAVFAQLTAFSSAAQAPRAFKHSGKHVILVTWDGVRPDEFFRQDDALLPWLWENFAQQSRIWGGEGSTAVAANTVFQSLPAYKTMMTGEPTSCSNNDCGSMQAPTLIDRLVEDLAQTPADIAVFASWEKIARATARDNSRFTLSTGAEPFAPDDPVHAEINAEQQSLPPPWGQARLDQFTVRHALRFLETNSPLFLWLSLNDTDEWGHADRFEDYSNSLRANDRWLRELVAAVEQNEQMRGQTCILLTTDHGRGSGASWTRHSNGVPESGQIFLLGSCLGDLSDKPAPRSVVSHLDIRPTVESLLGLRPRDCFFCGNDLSKEIAP